MTEEPPCCAHCENEVQDLPVESDAPVVCVTCYYDDDGVEQGELLNTVKDLTEASTVPDLWLLNRRDDS